ncbi:MAG: quinone oxidoreductase [Vicinamibacterales bacterium]
MAKAIRMQAFGDPSVLRYEDVPEPAPKAGEAVVKLDAAGVNYLDVYHRTGLYPIPLPVTIGQEGAGTVTAVGDGVTTVKPGDRVAWTGVFGSYAQFNAVPADRLVAVPAAVTTRQAAAAMLQGMTAHYLATSTYSLQPGDICLIHAGAGGVGLLLTQVAKLRGARVITTVSTDEKATLSKAAGADEVILYTKQPFEAEVKRLTDGLGVQVVYDSVGKTTFEASLGCLAPRGMLVLFGQSSGKPDKIDPVGLTKGSWFLTRPTIVHYTAERAELEQRAGEVFDWIQSGKLRLRIEHTFPLQEAAAAHRALEGRATTGKVLLIP